MRKTVTFLRSLQPKMAPQAALPPDSWGRGVKSGSSAAQKSRSCHKRTMSCEKTSFVPRQNDPLGLFRFNVLLCYLGFCAQDTSGTPKQRGTSATFAQRGRRLWHERDFCAADERVWELVHPGWARSGSTTQKAAGREPDGLHLRWSQLPDSNW